MSDRRESQDTSFIREPHSRLPHEVDVEDIVPLRYQTVLAVQLPPHNVGQELLWRDSDYFGQIIRQNGNI